jgi:hypothetical protein
MQNASNIIQQKDMYEKGNGTCYVITWWLRFDT